MGPANAKPRTGRRPVVTQGHILITTELPLSTRFATACRPRLNGSSRPNSAPRKVRLLAIAEG
jgi:hypothetical protein